MMDFSTREEGEGFNDTPFRELSMQHNQASFVSKVNPLESECNPIGERQLATRGMLDCRKGSAADPHSLSR